MQIFILGSQIAWITSPTNFGATSWSTGIVYFTEGCLIAFVVRPRFASLTLSRILFLTH